MTDAPSALARPGAVGARIAGSARAQARWRALAATLALVTLAAATADAQPVHVASSRGALRRPSVPALPAGGPTGTVPDPRLAPDEVVGILLDALAQADDADSTASGGSEVPRPIALVFAFASPVNKAAAGSVERFEAMVRDDAFLPLLQHRRATRGALRVDGDRATQRVIITTARGDRVAYTFVLGRQIAGAQRGCWMTESVTREAPSRFVAPYSA